MSSFYDVVVLGSGIGPFVSAALLAKRGFRVLLSPSRNAASTYRAAGRLLPTRPGVFLADHSPVTGRVLRELALHQMFRRKVGETQPNYQVALPNHRLDVYADRGASLREIEREFPEVKRPVEDFFGLADRVGAEFDQVLRRDLAWPAETFFETREVRRALSTTSLERIADRRALLTEFPDGHPFRLAVASLLHFASPCPLEELNAFAALRLYRQSVRGFATFVDGMEWFEQLLHDTIRMHGGTILSDEPERIVVGDRGVEAVRFTGSDGEIGCRHVVSGLQLRELKRLLPGGLPLSESGGDGRAAAPRFAYTLNLVLQSEAVPEGMGRNVLFVRDTDRPLEADNLLHIEAHPANDAGERLLCVRALLPGAQVREDPNVVADMRERIVESLKGLIPFLDSHLLLVDSPHDGRDPLVFKNAEFADLDAPWQRGPSTMTALEPCTPSGPLGVCDVPMRTPIKRLLLAGPQVVPALGDEGELLAAWSAARVITRSDRRRQWMRRGLWTKIEL